MDKEIEKLKKIDDIGWKLFQATGDIGTYGMTMSAKELIKEKEEMSNQNQPGGY